MKRILSLFLSFVICISCITCSFAVNASLIVEDEGETIDYSSVKFTTTGLAQMFESGDDAPNFISIFHNSSGIIDSSSCGSQDYWLIGITSYTDIDRIVVNTSAAPSQTLIEAGATGYTGIGVLNTNYRFWLYTYSSSSQRWIKQYGCTTSWCPSNFILNNYNFNVYGGTGIYYPVASNADFVKRSDNSVIQYGNYYDLLAMFNYDLPYNITDYSGHQTDPREPVTEPVTKDNSEEQLKVSNSILDNVKNVVESIFNLPSKIADKLGGFFGNIVDGLTSLGDRIGDFFTALKDGLLDGLKFLFVPSDNLFTDLIYLIKSKFGFVFQILELGDFFLNFEPSDTAPKNEIHFEEKRNGWSWGSFTVNLIDWGVIDEWIPFIKALSTAILAVIFIRKLSIKVVDAINGSNSSGGE